MDTIKTLTEAQVLKLTPMFYEDKIGPPLHDWFEIVKQGDFYTIKSGLKHVDEDKKSPYHFFISLEGKNAKKRCLQHFTRWWNYVNSEPYNSVMTYPTKYKQGFTEKEIKELCLELKVKREDFDKKFGINTCMSIDGETIFYHTDVLRAFRLVLENREMSVEEWD